MHPKLLFLPCPASHQPLPEIWLLPVGFACTWTRRSKSDLWFEGSHSIKGPKKESIFSSSLSGGLLDGVLFFFIGEVPLFERLIHSSALTPIRRLMLSAGLSAQPHCFKLFIFSSLNTWTGVCLSKTMTIEIYCTFIFHFCLFHSSTPTRSLSLVFFSKRLCIKTAFAICCSGCYTRCKYYFLVFLKKWCRSWNSRRPSNTEKSSSTGISFGKVFS